MTAIFDDDFTAPDGPNVSESKWMGSLNWELEDPCYTWVGHIANNTFVIGPADGDTYMGVRSNPTFKSASDNPVTLEFDAKIEHDYTCSPLPYSYGFYHVSSPGLKVHFVSSGTDIRTAYELPDFSWGTGDWLGISPQEWHHYKIRWTGTHAYWYVDGVLVDDVAITSDAPIHVGLRKDDSEIFYLDNVAVYGGEMFDNTPPGCSIVINDDAENTYCRTVILNLSAEDPESGVSEMCFANDNTQTQSWSGWESYNTTKAWTLPDCPSDKIVYVKYKNGAGLESLAYFDTINSTLTCGDENCDCGVNMLDTGVVISHIYQGVTLCSPWAANENCDSGINMVDVGAMIAHIYQGVSLNNCCEGCV